MSQYVDVTEASGYWYIEGEEYSYRILPTTSDYTTFVRLNSAGWRDSITEWVTHRFSYRDSVGTYYYLGEDPNREQAIIENGPTRVVVNINGNLCDTSENELGNSDSFEVFLYFYEWGYIVDVKWVTSGSITRNSNYRYDGIIMTDFFSLTNEAPYYRNSRGNEIAASAQTDYSTAQYMVGISDEVTLQVVPINYTDVFRLQNDESDACEFYLQFSGTVSSGTHRMSAAFLVDENVGYSEDDRKAFADGFLNFIVT